MTDDDLDLELDDEPARPAKRPAPRPTPPPRPAPAPAASTAPATPTAGQAAEQRAKTAGVRGPNLLQRMSDSVVSHRPTWDYKTFLIIFVALVVLVAFAENWSTVRFYFFGLRLEMPKAVAFLINAVIGALLMWFWLRRPVRHEESVK